MGTEENTVIEYRIAGREDGRWSVVAVDSSGKQLGIKILVVSPDEAIRVFMILNDRYLTHDEIERIRQHLEWLKRVDDEATEKIQLGKSA